MQVTLNARERNIKQILKRMLMNPNRGTTRFYTALVFGTKKHYFFVDPHRFARVKDSFGNKEGEFF